jgi:hypothetical protein
MERTRGNVVVGFDGNIVLQFEVIDGLEDGETLADCRHADLLELLSVEEGQDVAANTVFCNAAVSDAEQGHATAAAHC